MSKGKILILSGPSGVGKGTVVQRMLEMAPNLTLSVSATTRAPRQGEKNGVHYFYIDRTEFERKIANGELLEYNRYGQNYYGTLKSFVDEKRAEGKNVLLEIDINGGRQVKQKCPDAITVFLTAPSADEIERRLRERGTESEEQIRQRLEIARCEMSRASECDYVVCNDNVEYAAERILAILAEKPVNEL